MFHAFTPRRLAALALLVSAVAQAQNAIPYHSAFDGYQPFTEGKLKSWTESNDAVTQAGGWRAYAKEAAAPASQAAATAPATLPPAPLVAPPAAKPAGTDPHAGHSKH